MTASADIEVFADRLARAPDAGLKLLAAAAAAVRDAHPVPNEDLAGAFLETEAPMALDAGADAALARIDALAASDTRALAAANGAARNLDELLVLPDPVREAAFAAILNGGRFGFAGFGIRRLSLPTEGPGAVDLLRIEPGHGVASHDHEGEEFTLVLTGAFDDGHHTFYPGDINVGVPGFKHEPRALPGDVCYALAVAYGSAKFDGSIGLLQKLTGFGS